jgi:phosphate starvation-inducible protein PhoH
VVRHHLVQKIVTAYDSRDRKKTSRSASPVSESNKGVDG